MIEKLPASRWFVSSSIYIRLCLMSAAGCSPPPPRLTRHGPGGGPAHGGTPHTPALWKTLTKENAL